MNFTPVSPQIDYKYTSNLDALLKAVLDAKLAAYPSYFKIILAKITAQQQASASEGKLSSLLVLLS